MRHARIRSTAELLDRVIDVYRKGRGLKRFPHAVVSRLMPIIFKGTRWTGRGAHKSVHKIFSPRKVLVLKTTRSRSVRRDIRVYNRIPATVRNRLFAKIYWHTKYSILQKYGQKRKVPKTELQRLKNEGKRYGLSDIRPDNIRRVDGRFKIVDANIRKRRR